MNGDDLSNRSCLVVDDGQFIELAIRLARGFGKVYYHNPTLIEGFPTAPKWAIGNGFDEIEWVEEIWPVKDKVDLFIFPDISNSGIQLELEAQGKKVVGSRTGDRLEIKRIAFKTIQRRLGLNVPLHIVAHGLTELRDHLKSVNDRYVKIDRFRGSFETEHHVNYELSLAWLDKLACELGPIAEEIEFLVETPVKHEIEFGYDGFCFNGQLPGVTLFGPEVKSKSYAGAVTLFKNLDERIRAVTEALAGELGKHGYNNFLSNEIIIAENDDNFEDGEAVCIEPTCRIPSPPFESELETYSNLPQILWHGADGDLVDITTEQPYTVECRLTHDGDPEGWRALQIPVKTRQWIKLYDACKMGDTYHIAPKKPHAKRIGAAVGIGRNIEAAIEHLRGTLDMLKGQPVNSEFESLADAIKEIRAAEDERIDFGDQEIPEPGVVFET